MEPESYFDIVDRESVPGGHSWVIKEKLTIADGNGEGSVFLKRTSATESAALEAANQVQDGTAIPTLIQSGTDSRGHWIAIPFYPGRPPETEAAIPQNVAATLATMHAQYLDSEPLGALPLVGPEWVPALCAVPRLEQLVRDGRSALAPILEHIRSWSDHPVLSETLSSQPRTLLHGDVHRNNVIAADQAGHLVDWEGARFGMAMLDLPTLGGPGSPGHEQYGRTWRALTGEDTASLAWQRGYLAAIVCINVKYITFAARNFGDHRAAQMLDEAANALTRLEQLPCQ